MPRVTGQAIGTVQKWNSEEGWGVIDSAQTPGGCWAFYSDIVGEGFRTLVVGATVTLDWEQVTEQDGYRYRATRVEQHGS
ncbi:MAG: cold shock domain-containing protein [Comamonadaceae bacterium]|nr:MAG: cold shock domain-containing protein [Comamonadaceae bacterium]